MKTFEQFTQSVDMNPTDGFMHESKTDIDYKVGDIVGNTVQGFDFEVVSIKKDVVTVKNVTTKKVSDYYIGNFYKRKG